MQTLKTLSIAAIAGVFALGVAADQSQAQTSNDINISVSLQKPMEIVVTDVVFGQLIASAPGVGNSTTATINPHTLVGSVSANVINDVDAIAGMSHGSVAFTAPVQAPVLVAVPVSVDMTGSVSGAAAATFSPDLSNSYDDGDAQTVAGQIATPASDGNGGFIGTVNIGGTVDLADNIIDQSYLGVMVAEVTYN